MAHTCPECGQTCYCGFDIDDVLFDFEEDQMSCMHYLKPDCSFNDRDDDYE